MHFALSAYLGKSCHFHRYWLDLWRQIRTISDNAKIENLQNHKTTKTILENQNSHISYIFTGKLDLTDVYLPDM
jgi:hypothetical protein